VTNRATVRCRACVNAVRDGDRFEGNRVGDHREDLIGRLRDCARRLSQVQATLDQPVCVVACAVLSGDV
jgi:hypothetical protein